MVDPAARLIFYLSGISSGKGGSFDRTTLGLFLSPTTKGTLPSFFPTFQRLCKPSGLCGLPPPPSLVSPLVFKRALRGGGQQRGPGGATTR